MELSEEVLVKILREVKLEVASVVKEQKLKLKKSNEFGKIDLIGERLIDMYICPLLAEKIVSEFEEFNKLSKEKKDVLTELISNAGFLKICSLRIVSRFLEKDLADFYVDFLQKKYFEDETACDKLRDFMCANNVSNEDCETLMQLWEDSFELIQDKIVVLVQKRPELFYA